MENAPLALQAAGCLLQYVKDTQRTSLPHIRSVTTENLQENVILDAATRRNLEITQNLSGGTENTLSSVLDLCVTPMGSRMLKRWLHSPLRDRSVLANRQQAIAALMEISPDLQPVLRQIGDLERVLARRHCAPPVRVTGADAPCFSQYPDIQAQLSAVSDPYIQTLQQRIGQFDELQALLERAVVEAPPVLVRDGGVIAPLQ